MIREIGGADSLPVITIADAQRLIRDVTDAEPAALRLLIDLEKLNSLRGAGRPDIP